MMLKIGDIIEDRYVVQGRIASGGMSSVYRVQDTRLNNKNWALKHIVVDEQTTTHLDELIMLSKLSHPNIPNISDYIAPDRKGNCFLIMEMVAGKTLSSYFEHHNRKISDHKIVKYTIQLCEVLTYLHEHPKPIIYRDLKPDNIMLDERDNIKLIDFGIARTFKKEQKVDTVALGTIAFASPEQLENKQTDARSDLYSLGATLYFLLSGGNYFSSSHSSIQQLNCHSDFKLIIQKLLEYNANKRFQTANEVRVALAKIKLVEELDEAETMNRHSSEKAVDSIGLNNGTVRIDIALADKTVVLPINNTASVVPPKQYTIQATQTNPALIIYLIDVSGSMDMDMGSVKRIEVVRQALMSVIRQMVFRSTKGSRISSRYRIAIITYSNQVVDVFDGIKGIDEIAKMGFYPDFVPDTFSDAAEAFKYAEIILQNEIQHMDKCPAPLVCHMTDGAHTGEDPEPIAKRIMELSVPDGNVLIENIFISENILNEAIMNVKQWNGISSKYVFTNEIANKLARMSSIIPESYRSTMNASGYSLAKGALMLLPGINPELVSLGFQMSAATPVR